MIPHNIKFKGNVFKDKRITVGIMTKKPQGHYTQGWIFIKNIPEGYFLDAKTKNRYCEMQRIFNSLYMPYQAFFKRQLYAESMTYGTFSPEMYWPYTN